MVSASTQGDRWRGSPPPRAYQIHWTGFGRWHGHPTTVGRRISAPLPCRPAAGAHSPHRSAQVSVRRFRCRSASCSATRAATSPPSTGPRACAPPSRVLADKGIGALVVSSDGEQVDGIVSERDVARGLHEHGAGLLTEPVSSVMTAEVHTCSPAHERARPGPAHDRPPGPARAGGRGRRPVGIVSIGDVVKARLDELEDERKHMVDYIQTA